MQKYSINLIKLLLCFLPPILAQIRGDNECFQPSFRRAVSNLVPIKELWNVPVELCLWHCIYSPPKNQICSAVVYHKHFSSCQLYSEDGKSGKSKVVLAAGHNYFLRTSFAGACKTPNDQRVNQQLLSTPFLKSAAKQKGVPNYANTVVVEPSKFHTKKAAIAKPMKSLRPTYLLANKPVYECPPNEKLAFFYFQSQTLWQNRPVARIFKIGDLNQCLDYCVKNKNKQDDKIICMLASYNAFQNVCELYNEDAKEVQLFSRLRYSKSSYVIEKFCISSKKSLCNFGTNFEVQIGQQLVGHVLARLVGIETLSECINLCLSSKFCKSVNYKEKQCLLQKIKTTEPLANIVDTNNHNMQVNVPCVL